MKTFFVEANEAWDVCCESQMTSNNAEDAKLYANLFYLFARPPTTQYLFRLALIRRRGSFSDNETQEVLAVSFFMNSR